MTNKHILVLTLSTVLLAGTAVYAADQGNQATSEIKTADRDFTKLSTQGMTALRDVSDARLSIFNGHIDSAKKLIEEADTALDKAKLDNTAFMKAESELRAPPGITQPQTDSAKTAWLPIDSSMVLGEDYKVSPQKVAGVAKANEQMRKGDKNGAMDTLKLAGVDVTFTEELAPLDKTISGVQMAKQDIYAGHYYEANQDLKGVEDGIRFDTEIVSGMPAKTASAHT